MPPEKEYEPNVAPGIIDVSETPARLLITMDELDYLARLVAVDYARMIENRDHALAYGARGYKMPDEHELAIRLVHSFNMARTSAAIDTLHTIERGRQDKPRLAVDEPGGCIHEWNAEVPARCIHCGAPER